MPQGGETPGIEALKAPERSIEAPDTGASFETPAAPAAERPASASVPVPAPSVVAPAARAVRKDPVLKDVEHVLEEGMEEIYRKMDPPHQRKFSKEGDRVAGVVSEMVRKAKVKSREVLKLITGWLRIIPHVNRYYLDQEAKLKTDKILELGERNRQP